MSKLGSSIGSGTKWLLTALMITLLSAGCASVGDQRVEVLYQRSVHASGGSGDLYLVEEVPPPTGGSSTIQWVIGEIRNKDGAKLGNTVTDTAPMDTLLAAFTQEFKSAGYNTVQLNSMPPGAAKGMVLKSATVKLDEVKSPSNLEVKSKVTVSVEPWRDGRALTKTEYEADYSESAVTGRDALASKALLQTIQTIMKRSVPDIVKTIEQK